MPESNIEHFKYGQYSLTEEEKKKAEKEGKLKEMEKKMGKATDQLRDKQAEEALESLKKELEK